MKPLYSLKRRRKRASTSSIAGKISCPRSFPAFELLLYLTDMNYVGGACINQALLAERSLNQCSSALTVGIANLLRDFSTRIALAAIDRSFHIDVAIFSKCLRYEPRAGIIQTDPDSFLIVRSYQRSYRRTSLFLTNLSNEGLFCLLVHIVPDRYSVIGCYMFVCLIQFGEVEFQTIFLGRIQNLKKRKCLENRSI